MNESAKPRLVGLNHIALEVGNFEEALAFYRKIFDFELRGQGPGRAFIDMGDQFIALMEGRRFAGDSSRHFGLVVDDRSRVRELAKAAGATILEGGFLDFLDPWGNRVQVVEYRDVQFTKAPEVLRGMRLSHLEKNEKAKEELAAKGLA
jgi:catechol 2,3-dioxygenase-like lactoylglutathione lyase family enzyme